MEKKYARLAALLAAAVLCGNGAPSMAAGWWVGDGNGTIKITEGNVSDINGDVYGNQGHLDANGIVTGYVEMTGGIVGDDVYGGWADNAGDVKDSTVTISGGTVGTVDSSRNVYGGYSSSNSGEVSDNTVRITGGSTVEGSVYGGHSLSYSLEGEVVTGNTVTITSGSTVKGSVYGGYNNGGGEVSGNTVTITGCKVNDAYGAAVYGGFSYGDATGNRVTITDSTVGTEDSNGIVYGGWGHTDATNNRVTITDGTVNGICGGFGSEGAATGNTVTITGSTVTEVVYGGWGGPDATNNRVTITGGIVTGEVCGGIVTGDVCGGLGDADVTGNTVALSGDANVEKAALYGWKLTDEKGGAPAETADNDLIIDDWSGSTQSVKNFETIRFQGVAWDPCRTLLTIIKGEEGDLGNTKIDAGHVVILGGHTPQVSESMTFVKDETADTGLSAEQAAGGFTQGVATAGTAKWDMSEDRKTLNYTITGVFRNRQTDLIAENRLAGAAFVNQGADIAADSLRLLDDGYHWGTQTFGAVYGNRSQYDVASDIKINGWSEIAGFGNIHEVKGGRLAWGVFYENGTGNYRTWNTFNNEMFRGDGSLLYNGGGAAIRLTKDSGMYYEASLRAGTLSSSMTDAVRDGYGNSYGFDSDSTYWGAHIGAGKLIQRGSGQWDIYGKYFHTDIDGDSFEMGGDRFSFDSVTSDRLRLGARYTADTDKAWSLYCGAAYEYEFSGGSHMKAGQFEAPEQSLQGSTVFGEIGTVWGRKDSPWSMDVNLRGYAGEREGFSGMVQLAYAF